MSSIDLPDTVIAFVNLLDGTLGNNIRLLVQKEIKALYLYFSGR